MYVHDVTVNSIISMFAEEYLSSFRVHLVLGASLSGIPRQKRGRKRRILSHVWQGPKGGKNVKGLYHSRGIHQGSSRLTNKLFEIKESAFRRSEIVGLYLYTILLPYVREGICMLEQMKAFLLNSEYKLPQLFWNAGSRWNKFERNCKDWMKLKKKR